MSEIVDANANLDEGRVRQIELKNGFDFPAEYRRFLLSYNGGYPEPGAFRFAGSKDGSSVDRFLSVGAGEPSDLDQYMKVYKGRIPNGFLPVAHDPGGNLVCIGLCGTDQGRLYFWDHEKEADDSEPDMSNMYFVANSFAEFLRGLYKIEL